MDAKNTQIVSVGFHGVEIEAVHQGNDVWVPVRGICEQLGIAPNGQIEKLKDKEWSCNKIILSHDATGRKQNIFMLHLDSLPMWLATIDTNRVRPEARELLVKYQKEAATVLRDHFFNPKRKASEARSIKEARLMARENRLATNQKILGYQLLIDVAEKECPEKSSIYRAKLAELLTGERIVNLLPEAKKTQWRSAEEIAGDIGGVTSNRIGRIISELWGKGRHPIEGVRDVRMSKAANNHKMIPQSFYSPDAINKIRGALGLPCAVH